MQCLYSRLASVLQAAGPAAFWLIIQLISDAFRAYMGKALLVVHRDRVKMSALQGHVSDGLL